MAGTTLGGKAAAATNKAKYGNNFYHSIGQLGGRASTTGGFYANRKLARIAGRKGGKTSKRLRITKEAFRELYIEAEGNFQRMARESNLSAQYCYSRAVREGLHKPKHHVKKETKPSRERFVILGKVKKLWSSYGK